MKMRAVIFDVYRTIMHVGLPPDDADRSWEDLCLEFFGQNETSLPNLSELGQACDEAVSRDHEKAKNAGIEYPEVYWPEIMKEAFPPLQALEPSKAGLFMLRHILLLRRIQLMPGAALLLRELRDTGIPVGISSNAQPYTLLELQSLLEPEGLDSSLFDPHLTFWSWDHGFSKPNPHVFRILTARLKDQGIQPSDTLMVGDRVDNDVLPARAQGWNTWHLCDVPSSTEAPGGDWKALRAWLE